MSLLGTCGLLFMALGAHDSIDTRRMFKNFPLMDSGLAMDLCVFPSLFHGKEPFEDGRAIGFVTHKQGSNRVEDHLAAFKSCIIIAGFRPASHQGRSKGPGSLVAFPASFPRSIYVFTRRMSIRVYPVWHFRRHSICRGIGVVSGSRFGTTLFGMPGTGLGSEADNTLWLEAPRVQA